MKLPGKKETELKRTIARLRSRNQQNLKPISAEPVHDDINSAITRQRVSPNQNTVSPLERQAVLHAAIRDLLLGKMTQGQTLKKLRIEVLGLNQDAYAELTGVSRKTVSDVENDKGNYSSEIVNKIFKPFGLQTGIVPVSKNLMVSLLSQ